MVLTAILLNHLLPTQSVLKLEVLLIIFISLFKKIKTNTSASGMFRIDTRMRTGNQQPSVPCCDSQPNNRIKQTINR